MSSKEWKRYKLGEIVDDVAMGPFGSNLKVDNFISSGVPVIRGANLNDHGFEDENFVYVSEAKANSLKRSLAYPNELVFTHRGTIGQVGIIPHGKHPKYLVSQSQMRLTVSKKYLEPKFLYYFFRSSIGQYELLKNSSQVGVPAIASPTKALKDVEITLPPLPTQRRIVDILSALDEKIELNRQTNASLEAVAQAVFDEWFVDFNFPGATGDMVKSELGMIPSGWRAGKLGDILSFRNGKASPERNDNFAYPVYGANGIIGFSEIFNSRGNNLVIGRVGSFCGAVYFPLGQAFVTENAIIAEPLQDSTSAFYYIVLQNLNLNNYKSGSGQPLINQTILSGIDIIIPSVELIKEFEKIALLNYQHMFENSKQSTTLATIRDALLSKLMNGEIEV